jgi:hypothetical protein
MHIAIESTHPSSLRRWAHAVTSALLFALIAACSPDITPMAPLPNAPVFDLAEVEKPVPEDVIKGADDNLNGLVCAKGTPSGQVLARDDNMNTPSQPCPPAFALIGKGGAVKVPADFSADDENRNGVVCWKETRPGVYIAKDDVLETPSQPCPPGFNLSGVAKQPQVPAKDLAEADDNSNGVVCVNVIDATKDFIVKDDNLETPSQPCPPAFSVETPGKKEEVPRG